MLRARGGLTLPGCAAQQRDERRNRPGSCNVHADHHRRNKHRRLWQRPEPLVACPPSPSVAIASAISGGSGFFSAAFPLPFGHACALRRYNVSAAVPTNPSSSGTFGWKSALDANKVSTDDNMTMTVKTRNEWQRKRPGHSTRLSTPHIYLEGEMNQRERGEGREDATSRLLFNSAEQHVKALRVFALPVLRNDQSTTARCTGGRTRAPAHRGRAARVQSAQSAARRPTRRGEEGSLLIFGRARRAEHRGERSAVAAVV